MNLFEVIPDRFFSVLTGKHKAIFAEALVLLYEQYQAARFGIPYDIMRDLIQEMLESRYEMGIDFDLEEDSMPATVDDKFRFKANALLRRLRETNWIDVERRESFTQFIVLPHYSSRILAVLKDLCEDRAVEYQRFAFITYQLLSGPDAKTRPAFAVFEANRMTQQFVEELTVLANNIKHHMEELMNKSNIQEVLDHHFDVYRSAIVEKSYHRLKTSDHVSRYRQQILEIIQQWLLNKELLARTVDDAMRNEFDSFSNRDEAESKVLEAFSSINELYSGLDDIFREIDMRHNRYLRASYQRARYLVQHSYGTEQLIAVVLEWVSSKNLAAEEVLTELFQFQEMDQLSELSLFVPRKKPIPHEPEEHVVIPIPEELKQQLREKNLAEIKNAVTVEKVRDYIYSRMGDRNELNIKELAPTNLEEFIYLAHVYLYGYQKSSGYRLSRPEKSRILQIDKYRFIDRQIMRV